MKDRVFYLPLTSDEYHLLSDIAVASGKVEWQLNNQESVSHRLADKIGELGDEVMHHAMQEMSIASLRQQLASKESFIRQLAEKGRETKKEIEELREQLIGVMPSG